VIKRFKGQIRMALVLIALAKESLGLGQLWNPS
jgi:hypothetical protein